ncbi:uncharacterized protein LOC106640199 [Copidosoma floridanum]|uniref:uncharacterized protein LOC106640199 n=1 Tax=Copidosoma floridanum TaxID=29053 RepID=UPI0006C9AC86|nr:uncharacterized protein LOC106640199 [Copidosoma floridanum]
MTEDPAVRDGSYSKKLLKEFSRSRDKDKWDWEPNAGTAYPLTPRSRHRLDSHDSNASVILDGCVEPGWKLEDILLAAKLLLTDDPHQQNHYRDEAEMRRVYGLVYDVLRYETVLERALDDVGFWGRYGRLKKRDKVVRLLLYDMQGRKFARVGNGAAIARRNEALAEAGLLDIEKALLATRTRLAASLSRLRIGGSALSLDELLPAHLRTAEGVTWGEEGSIASGWVNSAKLPSRSDFVNEMSKLGLRLCSICSPTGELDEDQYAFDPLCPKVVNLHEKARERLAVSDLVRSHSFVFLVLMLIIGFQERSLCVGAAAMVQAIRAGKLCGPVIVTHGTTLAPRHTGYLAELLADVENAGVILVFALGDELDRHRAYLNGLGISLQRYKLYAERYPCAPSSAEIERATIVLATPPCSYTGVRDVVDLAIARGGDLRLLESLTSTDSESPRQPRVLLAEQMATLRYALTRPNVQLLFYEVHTLLPCETTDMIKQAFDYANKMARDKYLREHPQRKKPHPKEPGKRSKRKRSLSVEQIAQKSQQQDESRSNLESEEEALDIPESDLFEMSTLNDLYKQDCGRLLDPGSFIVVVKRKEMMQFNSLFMIKVAEAKGVFGQLTLKRPKTPEPTDDSCDNALAPPTPVPSDPKIDRKKSRKKSKIHFERLAAPTYASVARVLHERQVCPRHHQHLVHEESALESQKSPAPPEPIPDPPALITHCNSQSPPTDSSSEDDDDSDSCANEESPKAKERLESKYANGDSGGGSVVQRSSAKKLYSSALPSPMPDLFDDYVKRKGHGDLFNIRFKPMHLQARRHGPQLRARRLNRIPFQSRLDTVYEHSQSFSYTPSTRTSDGVLVDKGLLK